MRPDMLALVTSDAGRTVMTATITVGANRLSLLCGEVYEQMDGSLRLVLPDESILVQLNGAHPGRSAVW